MRDIIEIEKELMPYNFDIILGLEEYNMEFKYNKICDLFTCTLSKDDEILVYDEPLLYNTPLFIDVYNGETFPCIDIVPLDESKNSKAITYHNMGTLVFLTIDDNGDEENE